MKFLKGLIIFALVGAVFGASVSGPGCGVSVQVTPRQGAGGSYPSGSGVSQVYDFVITNNGRCNADQILLNVNLAAGISGTITQKWNLDTAAFFYMVTSFGSTLPVGHSVNAGVIVTFPNRQTVPANALIVSVASSACPSECVNVSQPATSSAATTSSTPPSSSGGSTTAIATGGAGGSCTANVLLTPRAGGLYRSGPVLSQVYDLTISNPGACGLTNVVLALGIPTGARISQSWNLRNVFDSRYAVTMYGGLLSSGSTANAGFIVDFIAGQTVPSGVTARADSTNCDASCLGNPNPGSGSTGAASSSTGSSSSGNCKATATVIPRPGSSYPSGSGVSHVYDISVTNTGSCALNAVRINLVLPPGAFIEQKWNLDLIGGAQYAVTMYGGNLLAGSAANAGIIVNFPAMQNVPDGVGASAVIATCNQCQ